MQSILLVPIHGAAGVIAGAVGFDSTPDRSPGRTTMWRIAKWW